ncbi:MAG TPA: DinB family protein [Candidatus Dormibacteraeota bacterium]|nr:DinB family protein [Candidatus Dormibacteraeota bacterium]
MNQERRRELVEKYRVGSQAVLDAYDGITDDELDRSASGEWTPREIAHHLADSELNSAIRLRRIVVEDRPVLNGYDEAQFARVLTRDRPIAPSLEAMRWARESSLQIVERLSDEEWERTGTHEESGPYSVDTWLEIYAAHPHEHAAQVRRSRGKA